MHPDQPATVKVTAYDYAIYGSLKGKVVSISPDTIQDEVKPEEFYYRVFIKTETDALFNKAGERFPIVPAWSLPSTSIPAARLLWITSSSLSTERGKHSGKDSWLSHGKNAISKGLAELWV
ncbi:HlyD family secretion protein [Brucella intermedia]|nr:HlyD family secretion protein [Brucella intermedia]WGG62579.1 HlyD family secretion protein [Brucella intermedia]